MRKEVKAWADKTFYNGGRRVLLLVSVAAVLLVAGMLTLVLDGSSSRDVSESTKSTTNDSSTPVEPPTSYDADTVAQDTADTLRALLEHGEVGAAETTLSATRYRTGCDVAAAGYEHIRAKLKEIGSSLQEWLMRTRAAAEAQGYTFALSRGEGWTVVVEARCP